MVRVYIQSIFNLLIGFLVVVLQLIHQTEIVETLEAQVIVTQGFVELHDRFRVVSAGHFQHSQVSQCFVVREVAVGGEFEAVLRKL